MKISEWHATRWRQPAAIERKKLPASHGPRKLQEFLTKSDESGSIFPANT